MYKCTSVYMYVSLLDIFCEEFNVSSNNIRPPLDPCRWFNRYLYYFDDWISVKAGLHNDTKPFVCCIVSKICFNQCHQKQRNAMRCKDRI